MTGTPDPYEHSDAAYVLGALGHEDRIAYEEHLRTCARCTAAVAELAALPGLLARLPALPAAAEPSGSPPDPLLPGLLTRVRRDRTRRRVVGAAGAVAASAVLVAGTAAVVDRTSTPDPAGVAVTMVGDAPVTAELRLEDVAWGTRITMSCRYDATAAPGRYDPVGYQLVVVGAGDAGTQSVARWQVLPGREAQVAGSTDLPVDEIAEVQLLDADGTLLLQGSP
jgi:anti-sigma factor RsiW